MTIWFGAWLTLSGIIGVVWLVRCLAMDRFIRRREVLRSDSYDGPPNPAPRLSVLVAAKDEQDNIERCITTLLNQDYPNFEVIAIDDRSTDATPDILRRLELGANRRLRVVTVRSCPAGWCGKNHAMREGVAACSGDWLLFTDADCRQVSGRTLSMTMRETMEHNLDFLSVTPVLETVTAWDKITQPVCALVLIIWFLPRRVNDPACGTAYANGAFMLLRRSCYDAIGGHEQVRDRFNEDIHLARLAKQNGFRLRVMENDGLYITRMYRTAAESWRGWSRIFFGCLGSLPRLAASATLLVFLTILPAISLLVSLIGLVRSAPNRLYEWSIAALLCAGVVILIQMVTWRWYGLLKIRRLWSLTYAFGATVTLGMLLNAMLKAAGATGTTWRGTTYPRVGTMPPRAIPREMETG